jgi:TonB-linked SusC/RagA family outer membrane protein
MVHLLGAVSSVLAVSTVAAQPGAITGKVTNEVTSEPLVAARVQVTGQGVFGITNQQGQYTIRGVAAGTVGLRIYMLGYGSQSKSVTVTPGQTATVDWSLKEVPFQLDEIVTTATGEQAARELGNSVAKIQTAQLVETGPTTTMMQVLSGRVAGVSVLQSNGTSGTGARIRIRGVSSLSLSNDPLLYIDGVRVAADAPAGSFIGGGSVSKLNDLNPEEIENIEVVKGPSAATLYGTQAANGVIRITTKRGRAGAPQWNAWAEGGVLEDTYTYPGTYFSKAAGASAACLPWQAANGTCQIENLHTLFLLNDPQSTPFTTGYRSQVGANVSGGTDAFRYFISAETELETGPLKLPDSERQFLETERGTADIPHNQLRPNHFNKHSFRLNLSANPRSNLDINVSSGLIINNIRLPQTGDNFSSMIGSPLFGSANPALFAATGGYGFSRPANSIGKETFRKNDHFINSLTVNWRPLGWLTGRLTTGLDHLRYADEQYTRNGQGCLTCATLGIAERQGFKQFNQFTDVKYTFDLNGTAQFELASRLASKTAVGVQYNHDKLLGILATAGPLPPGIVSLTAGAQKLLSEATTDVITLGTYVEQQFGLDNRLFVTGAVRIDDNSAFGRDFRSATYPKASISYQALEERTGWLNSFRVRAAYGATGNSPRPLDALTYDQGVTASIFGAANTPGTILGALGDNTLKPERSREIEAGFDVEFLNNRVNLEVTAYDKRTKDALIARPLAPSAGATLSRIENIGTVSNKGLEISVNARVIEAANLTWDVQLEASGNRNRLEAFNNPIPPITAFGNRNGPGYPLFGLWWPGLLSFSDADGDGFIEPTEVVVSDTALFLGSTIPTRTLALNTSWSLFKNKLRVGGQLDYRGGFTTLNVNDLFQCAFQINCRFLHDPTATLAEQARAIAGPRAFGAFAEKGDHIRFREVSVSYTAASSLARILGARTMSLTLTGRNVALWKFGFNSWDPENVTQSTDAVNYNFVQQAQPLTIILRLNLGF